VWGCAIITFKRENLSVCYTSTSDLSGMDVREEVSLSRGNKEGDTRSTNLITLPHNSSLPDHALCLPGSWIELA
jgi:hypothetical protein